ncbi:hypothetical protein AX16_007047 [Volvariella volvacea WC 439]|nr:hypothetical protein AX16_007047 [Volvariella volvacea WC 439]
MKRIIVACDGTGQSASRGGYSVSTNVSRLCHALRNTQKAGQIEQIIFYQSGIGTQDLSWGTKVFQQAMGEGIEDNIADAYTFIMNNYNPGDQIFIFGFSRGAFTAGVLANIVTRLGIFSSRSSWSLKEALRSYKEGTFDTYIAELQERQAADLQKWTAANATAPQKKPFVPRVHDVEIEVLGCWDTVASLGFPYKPVTNAGGVTGEYEHFDNSLNEGIKHAFHALALDEYRGPFTPTLWHLPDDPSVAKSIDLQQCWFPGVHTNVGGGYADQALADLTFGWMIDLCRPFLDFDRDYLDGVLDYNHQPWRIRSRERRKLGFDEVYQGWARGRWYDSYKEGDTWTWKYRTPGAYPGKTGFNGPTNETIHASVRERWQSSRVQGLTTGPKVWAPKSLEGFEPREIDGAWVWVKTEQGGWLGKDKGKEVLRLNEATFPARPALPVGLKPLEGEASLEWLLRYAPVTLQPKTP